MSSIFTYRIKLSILLVIFLFVGSCNTNDAPTPPNGNPPVVNKPDTTATNPPVVNKPDTTATYNPPVVNKPDTTATYNPPVVNKPNTDNNQTGSLLTDPSNVFAILKLSPQDYDLWNNHTLREQATINKIQEVCKSEIYSVFKDDFDFIIFAMNNEVLPTHGISGITTVVKNDVQGIGKELYDNTSGFGSAGKLQSISVIYRLDIDNGPTLHEIAHRWANYVVPQNYAQHWDRVRGVLSAINFDFSDIELYLAGAIPASDIKDPESLAIYNDPRFNNGNKTARIPDHLHAQKNFKALVVLVTPIDLDDEQMADFKIRVDNISFIPKRQIHPLVQNMYAKSRGLLTLSIGGLDKSRK